MNVYLKYVSKSIIIFQSFCHILNNLYTNYIMSHLIEKCSNVEC